MALPRATTASSATSRSAKKRLSAGSPSPTTPNGIRAAVVISDTHCGSTTGLLKPDFTTIEGQTIGLNAAQRFLWAKWEQLWSDVYARLDGEPFALILNGDLIDGNHHGTKQIISPDIGDHINAAEEAIKPHAANAAAVFLTLGTECHTGNAEESLAKMLKATSNPRDGRRAWDRLDVSIHGCPCAFHHHMPSTSREYLRHNALGIMLGNEQLAASRNNEPRPRVLGMAHRHTFDAVMNSYDLAFSTPPWQFGTRFVGKVAPHAPERRMECGGVLLDWRKREFGDRPDFVPLVYRPVNDIANGGGLCL